MWHFTARTEECEESWKALYENMKATNQELLVQMKEDEADHATTALRAGAAKLPDPVKNWMQIMSRVMTTASHWL